MVPFTNSPHDLQDNVLDVADSVDDDEYNRLNKLSQTQDSPYW